MAIAGIDGCKQGWLMVKYKNDQYRFAVYENFKALMNANTDLERIFIDIPIGLSSKGFTRTVESSLRKKLPGRQSTVFNPPCREALAFDDYNLAKTENLKIEGKGLSIQAFFISKKIKDVDDFLLQNNPGSLLFESHPELCFKYLNPEKKVLQTKKATAEGAKERLEILLKHDRKILSLYQDILRNTKRKDVKKDDILDAVCLCIASKQAKEKGPEFIEDDNNKDLKGIPVRIACFHNKGSE